jgi:predicted ABC-type ATPase
VLSGNAETRFEQAKKIIKELEKAKEMGFSVHMILFKFMKEEFH